MFAPGHRRVFAGPYSAESDHHPGALHVANDDERIALFLDYENLAIGARDGLGVSPFDFGPIADALAERGRVVVRRAYADWSYFDEDRRLLARAQVELIEIPQRMGGSRKNAADIKMAVDAIELAFERGFITTFAIGTGDSDFTPLVHKLRELDKRVIGIGVAVLDVGAAAARVRRVPVLRPAARRRAGHPVPPAARPGPGRPSGRRAAPSGTARQARPGPPGWPGRPSRCRRAEPAVDEPVAAATDQDVGALVARTLAGLQRHADGPVLRVAAQARDPAQGPHVRRGRPRLPRVRRAAAPPGGPADRDAAPRARRRATPRSRSPPTTRPTTTRSACSWTW